MLAVLLALLVPAEGRPLHYWGGRAPTVVAEAPTGSTGDARALEVHALADTAGLLLRFTFDRPVRDALRLPDGAPVSGRLQAVLYLDLDDDRTTGFDGGPHDLRTGADARLELGTVFLGADPDEGRRDPVAVVTAVLDGLDGEGRRQRLSSFDQLSAPGALSVYGEWVDLHLSCGPPRPRARLILAVGDRVWDGRLAP